MSDLAGLLELLHTAVTRWRTLHAEGWQWRDTALHRAAWAAAHREDGSARTSFTVGHAGAHELGPTETHEPWRLWLSPPDRLRTEFRTGHEPVTAVVVRDTWWSWSPSRPVTSNHGDPSSSHGVGPAAALVEPAAVLPAMEFAITGRGLVANRPALEVRATPSPVPSADEAASDAVQALHGLGIGADEYRLHVDSERGVLLRSEAQLDGAAFQILEINRITFDEVLPEATFQPPAGAAVQPLAPAPRSVRPSEASSAVGFVVLVPEHPPFAAESATVMPANPEHGVSEQIRVHYASMHYGQDERQFTLIEAAAPLPEGDGTRWAQRGDIRIADNDHGSIRRVRVERHGVHVEIQSKSLPIDELHELARSLVPLPRASASD